MSRKSAAGCASVEENSPAAKAGLQAGDVNPGTKRLDRQSRRPGGTWQRRSPPAVEPAYRELRDWIAREPKVSMIGPRKPARLIELNGAAKTSSGFHYQSFDIFECHVLDLVPLPDGLGNRPKVYGGISG